MFDMAERGTDIVRSMTLFCERLELTPLRGACKFTTASPVAEHFVFENAHSAKKLDIYVWSIKEVDFYDSLSSDGNLKSLHYAFLLK